METRIHAQICIGLWYLVIAQGKDKRGNLEKRISKLKAKQTKKKVGYKNAY